MSEIAPGLRRVEHVMGMAVSLDIRADTPDADLARLADEVFAWLRWVDATFSTYRHDSEISRLDRGALRLEQCSREVREVLRRCRELAVATGGYFDPRATGRLDPSGLVKGWAVERASAMLAARGAGAHCLNAGGDVRVRGAPEPGRSWRVGVRHPDHADAVCLVLEGGDLAIATSGTYERGPHVVDPHTGRPATDLVSVTVTGPDLATADAYATAALAMGPAALDWLPGLAGYASCVIHADGRLWHSPDLPLLPLRAPRA